jgi:hypothetical protein
MSNNVQTQHPAVVLRSSYQHLQALFAIAAIAIVGLTVAVVALALNNSSGNTTVSPAVRANPSALRAHSSAKTGIQPRAVGASCGDACSGHGYASVGMTTSDYPGHY